MCHHGMCVGDSSRLNWGVGAGGAIVATGMTGKDSARRDSAGDGGDWIANDVNFTPFRSPSCEAAAFGIRSRGACDLVSPFFDSLLIRARSGDSRGFGFLSLERDEDADAAIRALDQSEWNGRIVLFVVHSSQLIHGDTAIVHKCRVPKGIFKTNDVTESVSYNWCLGMDGKAAATTVYIYATDQCNALLRLRNCTFGVVGLILPFLEQFWVCSTGAAARPLLSSPPPAISSPINSPLLFFPIVLIPSITTSSIQSDKKTKRKRREMGNCIRLQKPVTWVDEDDDDWGSEELKLSRKHQEQAPTTDTEEKTKAAVKSTEIKIKISKKQLEELLRQADAEGLPLLQVLAAFVEPESHWRPKLQPIPE
ncbi:hypothetical protein ZIOFF_072129 [Zingiber officinale]|uniref:RRM domain-containing protein n=1 Tax=Zingiber officinale TaxID=94328 RepID=A0A8J5CV69_ZINOF|nr:hypothetical protein ZIOFF_072129 [Zingiber officinale]